MDWDGKAVTTAVLVALLLLAGRCFGRRMAGVLAGLPTVTGPALLWLSLDHGARYAVDAAIGSVAACAVCALFALVYERASRRAGVVIAPLLATGASLCGAVPLQWLDGALAAALPLAIAAAWLAQRLIPDVRREPRFTVPMHHEITLTALVAGGVSGAVALAAPQVGAFWAGVIASPPLIAAVIAVHQHAFDGQPAAQRFLRGYVGGLLGRAAFGAGFACMVMPLGPVAAALSATALACALAALAVRRAGSPTVPRALF
jgi:hypothetical protein